MVLRLALTTVVLFMAACNGALYNKVAPSAEDGPCATVHCGIGESCAQGVCLLQPSARPCNATNLHGDCRAEESCVAGVCYPQGATPAACSLDSHGVCLGDGPEKLGAAGDGSGDAACVAGRCQAISARDRCGAANPTGLCAGGGRCVGGRCYVDEGLTCSLSVPEGLCPPFQSCMAGACHPFAATCGVDNFVGTCPTGHHCVQGICIGPVPPNACTADRPNGRCPRDEACVGGTCVPLGVDNACSALHPAGLCPPAAACTGGRCVAISTSNVCSRIHPRGLCSGGARCVAGACVLAACDAADNWLCAAGMRCTMGHCLPLPCDAVHPAGVCVDSTLACVGGSCVQPTCGPDQPDGICPHGLTCVRGGCAPPACAPTSPYGPCPGPDSICVGGVCANGPCGADNTHGYCIGTGTTSHPALGYLTVPLTCCDAATASSGLCALGTCAPATCTPDVSHGMCGDGLFCDDGHCQTAPCSPFFVHGPCTASDERCVMGQCRRAGCVMQPDPSSFCAPNECDVRLDACTPPACSPSRDQGLCPLGMTCCNAALAATDPRCSITGQCMTPSCSTRFPGGACPGDDVCAAGVCHAPSCSPLALHGICPPHEVCVAGACTPEGCTACPPGTQCVNGACATPCGAAAPTGFCAAGLACVERACSPVCPDDADCDNIRDSDEGLAQHVDTDGDGIPDAYDRDSDADGIPDLCEATDVGGLCGNKRLLATSEIAQSDGDNSADFRDQDSDNDGIPDAIEARAMPARRDSFRPEGVDHDGDGVPDYRDPDSDGDGVADIDEDVNGDGVVNCQVDSLGQPVPDLRLQPLCGAVDPPFSATAPYDFNPGCDVAQKCLTAETSRVHADSSGRGINDSVAGIFLVSGNNLKPVNVFHARDADYDLALENGYTTTRPLMRRDVAMGMTFDAPDRDDGYWGVSGFILNKQPSAAAMATRSETAAQLLLRKALVQAQGDLTLLSQVPQIRAVKLVIDRNATSFDGYGMVISRYRVLTVTEVSTSALRDSIAVGLDPSLQHEDSGEHGPVSSDFTLVTETLYRYDDGVRGAVLVLGALVQTGANESTPDSYSYRTLCAQEPAQSCAARPGCVLTATGCAESGIYQIPLFYADNIANGSAVTQYGNGITATTQTLVQKNGLLDFLWVVDNSPSMAPKIGQVLAASGLFFGLLNTTEADYRIAQVTTAASITGVYNQNLHIWEPVFPGCVGLQNQPECETSAASGGCTWDPVASTCGPLCLRYHTNMGCITAGCTWNPGEQSCYFAGCAAVSEQCDTIVDPLVCQRQGCDWQNDRCAAPTLCKKLGCSFSTATQTCGLTAIADRSNGVIAGDFTGAIAGIAEVNATDRSVAYACREGCTVDTCPGLSHDACTSHPECAWDGAACVTHCCPACDAAPEATPNDPACYFAARLPNDNGSGFEFGLLMAQWALYRAGAQPTCATADNAAQCVELPGCMWAAGACVAGYCSLTTLNPNPPTPGAARGQTIEQEECNGNNPTQHIQGDINGLQAPFGRDNNADELEPSGCEWDAGATRCVPSIGPPCGNSLTPLGCALQGARCLWSEAASTCAPSDTFARVLCSGTDAASCLTQAPNWCVWDTCAAYADNTACDAVFGCGWNGATCLPTHGLGTCHPPLKRALRANASKIAVILSDEEECFVKDGPASTVNTSGRYNSQCEWYQYGGGLLRYDDPIRLQRTRSYLGYFASHGVQAFALVGDKADASAALGPADQASCERVGCRWVPGSNPFIDARCLNAAGTDLCANNGGCFNNGGSTLLQAEAGQAYIDVAEGTGGGWGSICASNLYPSIESMVMASIARASPYKLSFQVKGHAVQPVASTLKVAVQLCNIAAEYPGCKSGSHVVVVPRSRSNGFDYDAINNVVILYGSARALPQGDIVVSYRYFAERSQRPEGSGPCACPETQGNHCECAAGFACGAAASGDRCITRPDARACERLAGCAWNSANGGVCEVTGICELDSPCGHVCLPHQFCNVDLGQCVCDTTCPGGCPIGARCDDAPGSATCGACVCDLTCGGGCAPGSVCNTAVSARMCGMCEVDKTCGGACPFPLACDPLKGLCGLNPLCGGCPPNFACNAVSGHCEPQAGFRLNGP